MKIAMVTECRECGRILEAPLMRGADSCCRHAVRDLCIEFLKENYRQKLGREAEPEEVLPFIEIINAVIDEGDINGAQEED